ASPGTTPSRVGVLVMSHGTPAAPDEVAAFYTEIRRGSPPSPEQLADLERRYAAIGGVSPLAERTREQVSGIDLALDALAPGRFVVAGGAKFAPPRIEAAVEELAAAGVDRIVGIVLAPHSAEVSVGEYRRRATAALAVLAAPSDADRVPELVVVDHWHDAPGLSALLAQRVTAALGSLPAPVRADAIVLFTAHSVPARFVDAGDPYAMQVAETAAAVAEAAGLSAWELCWQSAGRTADAWLGPDLLEVLRALPDRGVPAVVVCPAGFVSDHLEILYDLDIEARTVAEEAGVAFARTASFNADPRFCEVLARVVLEAAGPHDGTAG
ncbi:MAG TPA: ferrochelatase, partial [Candidatus Sulfotelmatobacter sp.]|nr:ferrochelatase [Candidatus Sulfotelmatobacter sp.]